MAEERGDCAVITTPTSQKANFTDNISNMQPAETTTTFPDLYPTACAEDEATPTWRFIGDYEYLKVQKCRRVYSKKGSRHDLGLFFDRQAGTFHVLGAWCGHMGGPLFEGDIEDYKGTPHVMCPWHAYMFDLKTGKNDIGLEQSTYIVRVDQGKVFILHSSPLSLYPFL